MNQVWHIFRKDVRHLWREIAVLFALGAAFNELLIEQINSSRAVTHGGALYAFYGILGLSTTLAPLALIYLTARVVHDEALAGDRQFWITRPYDWKKLLAAKVLFFVVFVNLPLFLGHIVLLAKAGFHPFAFLSGLLWLQVIWTAVLILPIAGLATVTRSTGQMFLGALIVALFSVVLSVLRGAIPNSAFSQPSTSFYFAIVVIAAAAVILLQYSLRKTTQSRILIAALAAVLVLVLVAAPYRTLIAHAYPQQTDFPVKVSLMHPSNEIHYTLTDRIPLSVAFNLSDLPKDSFLALDGVMLHLTNSSGQSWNSGWQNDESKIFSGQTFLGASVELPENALNRLKSSPMSGDVLLAVTLYHDANQRPFVIPRGEFALAGLGLCNTGVDTIGGLSCRIPIRRPPFLMISSDMISSTCPLSPDRIPPRPGQIARAFVRDGSEPGQSDLSPVQVEGISLSGLPDARVSGLCPGTPVTLSNPEVAARTSIEVHLDSAWLAAYMQALHGPQAQ